MRLTEPLLDGAKKHTVELRITPKQIEDKKTKLRNPPVIKSRITKNTVDNIYIKKP